MDKPSDRQSDRQAKGNAYKAINVKFSKRKRSQKGKKERETKKGKTRKSKQQQLVKL